MPGKSIFFCLLLGALLLPACNSLLEPANPAPIPDSNLVSTAAKKGVPDHNASNCQETIPEDSTIGVRNWPDTNFCRHSVAYEEIQGVLGKDSIASLDDPKFESVEEAGFWLTDREPVLVLEMAGEARAYPLPIMIWHEIVNDTVDGIPLVVTYCPLCNSALVFERRLEGLELSFGTTGNLRNADLIMYDRKTESWWQQFEGEAIVGDLTGSRLKVLPSQLVSFGDFRKQFPDGRVLSIDTGFDRRYGENPYINYDSLVNSSTKYFPGQADPRLQPKQRVLALQLGSTAVAYPYDSLSSLGVINDTRGDLPLVVFWKSGTVSPLYGQYIFDSTKDIGSAAAFSRELDGQVLTFESSRGNDALFQDVQTRSQWNIFGSAVDGPLAGRQLMPLPGHEFFWFAWAAFQPDAELFQE